MPTFSNATSPLDTEKGRALAHRRERDLGGLGEFAHGRRAPDQMLHHVTPGGIAQPPEYLVDGG